MKSHIKRIASIVTCVCMLLSTMVVTAFADTKTYTAIDTVANLTEGTYYMAAYVKTTTQGDSYKGYHLYTGGVSSGDLYTAKYNFANGELTAQETYTATTVVLTAVEGKANTYTIKDTKNNKYITVTDASNNRKLALSTTPMEWEAVANSKGGINFKATIGSNSCFMGTANNCKSNHIRSYKSSSASSSLGYGLVFFKEDATGSNPGGGTPGGTTPPPATFDPSTATPAEIVEKAYELTGSETIDGATLTGKITVINTAYNSEYGNITVTIDVDGADKTMYCYRMKAESTAMKAVIANLAVGDTITITGNIVVYNNAPQFAAGSVMTDYEAGNVTPPTAPQDPKEIVDAAFALTSGGALPYKATLTGEVVSIDTAYSDQYKNITVTIEVEGSTGAKNIQCYRLKGADGVDASTLAEGDVITVTGDIINYNGKVQFNTGATYVEATAPNPGTGVESFVSVAVIIALAAAAVVVFAAKKERA